MTATSDAVVACCCIRFLGVHGVKLFCSHCDIGSSKLIVKYAYLRLHPPFSSINRAYNESRI